MGAGAPFLKMANYGGPMEYIVPSSGKINVSLRITGKRPDGFHSLKSIFFRLSPLETLTIKPQYDHNVKDKISLTGEEVQGRNILEDVLEGTRKAMEIPPLHIDLMKTIPPGSGLGGGSGNGAALLSWIEGFYGGPLPRPEVFGSDVSFLHSMASWAVVSGRGEKWRPLAAPPPRPEVVVVVPNWTVSTAEAFSAISKRYGETFPTTDEEAEGEIESILGVLKERGRVGLLPNDFSEVLQEKHPQYGEIFTLFEECSAAGWGITGSGSGCFGLFYDEGDIGNFYKKTTKLDWIKKIICLE